jgi:hypothetical protein
VPLNNVIPIGHKYAFNPSPLLPRKLTSLLEAAFYKELEVLLGEKHPVRLMIALCLSYRPSTHYDSTVALAWARHIAKDLRWRVYQGTYDYLMFGDYFVKLTDRGISFQSILLSWVRELSSVLGENWYLKTRDELVELQDRIDALGEKCIVSCPRLTKACYNASSVTELNRGYFIANQSQPNPMLEKLEYFRNLIIEQQLSRIASKVEEHFNQG